MSTVTRVSPGWTGLCTVHGEPLTRVFIWQFDEKPHYRYINLLQTALSQRCISAVMIMKQSPGGTSNDHAILIVTANSPPEPPQKCKPVKIIQYTVVRHTCIPDDDGK